MRIVLAEDEALLREGLRVLLEHAGHDVVASVSTATKLLHAVRQADPAAPPDIVITDVRMPRGPEDAPGGASRRCRHSPSFIRAMRRVFA